MERISIKLIMIVAATIATYLTSCSSEIDKTTSIELITDAGKQDSIFHQLLSLTANQIPQNKKDDSLAFLLLPVEASCPSCRKKTIDSIVKHQDDLGQNHYVIISADGGRKTMSSYFKEQEVDIPNIAGHLFLDSANQAWKLAMFKNNPAIYYTANQKAYKKVLAIPATVREDLREFFSGHRQAHAEN